MKQAIRDDFNLIQSIRNSFLPAAGGLVIANPFLVSALYAAPQGGHVIAGQADIHPSNNNTVIHQQSNRAVINWNSFNINANESVKFIQPGASSAVLNRIVNQNPTTILGKLNANGQVFIVNPNGVVFGKTARINVGGIVASSLNIKTDDFMNGRYVFTQDSKKYPGKIINKGLIKAASSGVVMIGSSVMNEGRIYARLGNVAMVSADKVTVDFDGDGLIQFEINRELIEKDRHIKQAVSNTGQIVAEGGDVILSASTAKEVFSQVVNNEGVIKASRIQKQGGDVFLIGGSSSDIVNTGEIDVSGQSEAGNIILNGNRIDVSGRLLADSKNSTAGSIIIKAEKSVNINASVSARGLNANSKAGKVNITGEKIRLKSETNIDVSGIQGGGEVLVGGDFQGKGDLKTAEKTSVEKGSHINADAVITGKGGKVIIWSDDKTTYKGQITAKGGKQTGDGGFVEVSGKKKLNFKGEVNTSADNGSSGTLLLDPEYIKVAEGDGILPHHILDSIHNWLDSDILYSEEGDDSITITENQLESINSDIILQATVGIEFESFELELNNNLTIETRNDISEGDDQKQTDNIHGINVSNVDIKLNNGDLILNSGQDSMLTGQDDPGVEIKLGKIETAGSLSVASSGKVTINRNIKSGSDVLLDSGNKTLETTLNVVIESTGSSVTLNGKLNSTGNSVNVNALTEVNLAEAEADSLTVQSDKLNLKGDITAVNNIDFSAVNNVQLNADINLSSDQNIDSSNGISGTSNSLSMAADTINLGTAELGGLDVQADTLNLSGDLNLNSAVDFTSVNTLQVAGSRTIDTASANGNINLQQTRVQGNGLSLDSGSGNIYLGQVSLDRLSLMAQQAHLFNNITTRYQLDLNNISTLVLQNDLTLSSTDSSLNLGADINGSYALILDADTINLSGVNSDSLNISRNGSQTFLSGDITTQNSISFADNSSLTLLQNSQLQADGDIKLAEQISGSYILNVNSQSGDLDIGQVSLEGLDISSQGQTRLHGNISTTNTLDFTSADNVQLNADINLSSDQNIDLSNGISGTGNTLNMAADIINLGTAKLGGLDVQADTLNLSGDLNLNSAVDFAYLNTLQVAGSRTIDTASANGNINLQQTRVQGNGLSLDSGSGNIYLGQVSLDRLSLMAQQAHLFNNITTRYQLDLNNISTLVLQNDLTLSSTDSSLNLGADINGSYALILDADTINLSGVNSDSLNISRNGSQTFLSGDITTQNSISFADNSSLTLLQNSQLQADGDIKLAEQISGSYILNVNSQSGDLDIGQVSLEGLDISSQGQTRLSGNITTLNNIDFSSADKIQLVNDVVINSDLNIDLRTDINGDNYTLDISADRVDLKNIEISRLNINTPLVYLSGDINSHSSLNFANVNTVSVVGNVEINTAENSNDINLSSSLLKGNNLTLNAGNGNIQIGRVLLESLKIYANNGYLYDDIDTRYLLDLNNVTTVVLENAITLKSDYDALNVETDIVGNNYDLILDADVVHLNNLNVSSVDISRSGSSVDLSGNINVQTDLKFADNSNLEIHQDVQITAENNIYMADVVTGNYQLDINANNGDIHLAGVNINELLLNAEDVFIDHSISTQASLNFSNVNLNLNDSVNLSSYDGNIILSNTLNANNHSLDLQAKQVELYKLENLYDLGVAADQIFVFNDISAINGINLSAVQQLSLNNNLTLESGDYIYLPDNMASSVAGQSSLTLESDYIQINRLGMSGKELNNLQADAQTVKISDNIKTKGVMDFQQVENVLIDGVVALDSSIGNSNIILSQSVISGDDLVLNSGSGDIDMGRVNVSNLNISAENLNLYDDITAQSMIDLSNINKVILLSDTGLSSSVIDLKSHVSGESYNLILNADSILLGLSGDTINLNALNIVKNNSYTDLYASLDLSELNFAGNTIMDLQDNVTISTQQQQVHADTITGDYALNLNSSGDRIEINKVDVNSLNVVNTGVTQLNNDITTVSDINILSSSGIGLKNDVSIASNNSSINMASNINGNNYELNVQSDSEVLLGDVDINKLYVKADSLKLSGSNLHASEGINLENANLIEVDQNFEFSTDITGLSTTEIRLDDIKADNNYLNISFVSDSVSLGDINKGYIPESLKVKADNIYLNKDLSARKNIELNASNIYLNDNLVVQSDSGLIELSGSKLYGNLHNLTLKNTTGNINLGRIDNVNNLYVYTSSSASLTAPVNSYMDQDYRGVNNLKGNTIDLYSEAGTIYLNNITADNLNTSSQNNLYLSGKIITDDKAILLSRQGSVNMSKNAEVYGDIINLKAKSDVLLSYINGRDMRVESTNGSLLAIPTGRYNIEGDTVRLNVRHNIGSYSSPLYVNVNRLIIESATNAFINGIFKYQEIQGQTRFSMPELEFTALIRGYYLDLDEFKTIDNSIFLMGINLFSVADDAVNTDENTPEFYSENQNLNNHLTMK